MRRRIKKATEKQQVARACAFFGFHSFRKARSGGPFAFAASDGGAVALDARVKPAHDGWGVARASHPFLSSPSASEPRVHRAAAQGSPRYSPSTHSNCIRSVRCSGLKLSSDSRVMRVAPSAARWTATPSKLRSEEHTSEL